MPAFCHYYGLKPWDLERLTAGEIDELLRQLPKGGVTSDGFA